MKTIIRLSVSRIRDIGTIIVLPVYFALKPSTYWLISALVTPLVHFLKVISALIVLSANILWYQYTYRLNRALITFSVHLPPYQSSYHVIRYFFQVISGTYRVISRPTLILLSVQFCDIGTLNALSLHKSYYQLLAAIQKTRVRIPIPNAKIFY